VIRKISKNYVETLAGNFTNRDYVDGIGSEAKFRFPHGIVIDPWGSIYVSDGGANTIRKISEGTKVTTLAGSSNQEGGLLDGIGDKVLFSTPSGIALDSTGIYVTDYQNHVIRRVLVPFTWSKGTDLTLSKI
jgi:sugar lactone lactonase YvrE